MTTPAMANALKTSILSLKQVVKLSSAFFHKLNSQIFAVTQVKFIKDAIAYYCEGTFICGVLNSWILLEHFNFEWRFDF